MNIRNKNKKRNEEKIKDLTIVNKNNAKNKNERKKQKN